MYGIYANIGGILMVNVTIYSIHGSYGLLCDLSVIFGSTNSQKNPEISLDVDVFFAPRIIPARGDDFRRPGHGEEALKISLFRNRAMKPMTCHEQMLSDSYWIHSWYWMLDDVGVTMFKNGCLPAIKHGVLENPPLSSIILNMPRFSSLNADLWCTSRTSPASHAWLPEGIIHFLWFVLCLIRKDMDTNHFEEMNHWTVSAIFHNFGELPEGNPSFLLVTP